MRSVEVATGRSDVPYDRLQSLGVQVYGMPPGIPFHSPLLYSQQQLQQILANLEKIVFLKVGSSVSAKGRERNGLVWWMGKVPNEIKSLLLICSWNEFLSM